MVKKPPPSAAAGRRTEYTYNARGLLTQTTYPDSSTSQSEYDAAGRMIAALDARGNRTEYTLDAAGRQTAVKDALGNITQYSYDQRGNRVSMTDANGNTMQYVFDLSDRLIETRYADGTTSGTDYDARGRKVSATDQAGNTTFYEYDGVGNLTKVINALGHETTYSYDEQNNKLTQTDAEGRTTKWAYDNVGRVISRTLPMGQVESFVYDVLGNRTQHIDFKGQITDYQYDILNRETRREYQSTGRTVDTVYTVTGQVAMITDHRGVTSYTYDARDRLVKVSHPTGQTIDYQYDVSGNRTQLATQNDTVNYSFDGLNRLASVTDAKGTTAYEYDAVGNRAAVNYANGTAISYQYNELNRLIQVQHLSPTDTVTQQFDYQLADTGHRLKITEFSGRVSDYQYDETHHLLQEAVTDTAAGNRTTDFSYDKVGNRLNQTENGISTRYTYDANDRLLESNDGTAITSYQYDANGNTTQQNKGLDVTAYEYSQDNRMLRATNSMDTLEYSYNAGGIRQSKTKNGTTTNYLVDQNRPYAQVITELDDTSTPTLYFTYGDDLISQTRNNQSHYYLYDGLGSTRGLSDDAGATTDTYAYRAFGELEQQIGSTLNDYLFAGEQRDSELGQYYLRARYYNQTQGRFTQLDTFDGFPARPITNNKYIYANSDAVNWVDPSGHFGLAEASVTVNIVNTLTSLRIESAFNTFDALGVDNKNIQSARLANRLLGLASLGAAGYQLVKLLSPRFARLPREEQFDVFRKSLFRGTKSVKPRSSNKIAVPSTGTITVTPDTIGQLQDQATYIYVVTQSDELVVALRGSAGKSGVKHTQLNGGGAAKAAGELRVNGNQIEINNSSGRYRAQDPNAVLYVRGLLSSLNKPTVVVGPID